MWCSVCVCVFFGVVTLPVELTFCHSHFFKIWVGLKIKVNYRVLRLKVVGVGE